MDTKRTFYRFSVDGSVTSPLGPPIGRPVYGISKPVTYLYASLGLLMVAIGLALSAFSLMWIQSGQIHHMVLADGLLPGVLLVGCLFISTFLLSIPGLLHIFTLSPTRPFSTLPLDILSYVLILDELTAVSVGVTIWFRTLRERALFEVYWNNGSSSFRSMLEDYFNCCGYYTCSSDPSSTDVCVDAIQDYADKILNHLFTCVFASTGVIALFWLCTLCIIAEIKLLNRYRLIDIRQGRLRITPQVPHV